MARDRDVTLDPSAGADEERADAKANSTYDHRDRSPPVLFGWVLSELVFTEQLALTVVGEGPQKIGVHHNSKSEDSRLESREKKHGWVQVRRGGSRRPRYSGRCGEWSGQAMFARRDVTQSGSSEKGGIRPERRHAHVGRFDHGHLHRLHQRSTSFFAQWSASS